MRHPDLEWSPLSAANEVDVPLDDRVIGDAAGDGAPVVLVIEDDEAVRTVLCSLLRDAGYRVVVRDTIPGADETAAWASRANLIVLDVVFDGEAAALPFLAHLAADPRTAAVPVLLCTAAIDRVREAGDQLTGQVAGIIAKPFDADDLLRIVSETLGIASSAAGRRRAATIARR